MSLRVVKKLLIVACAGSIFFSAHAFAFETNGDLDLSFAAQFTNGQVQVMVMQPDGKLVIAGAFSKVNGVARRNIARLMPDGSLDTSFDALGSTDGTITQVIRQTDGAFIIL
ncbi:MAG: delta-60 repeat domain-containing protein, partial [Chthoniobacterales bacterium]